MVTQKEPTCAAEKSSSAACWSAHAAWLPAHSRATKTATHTPLAPTKSSHAHSASRERSSAYQNVLPMNSPLIASWVTT